jgi:hypothetical protein
VAFGRTATRYCTFTLRVAKRARAVSSVASGRQQAEHEAAYRVHSRKM